MTQGTAGAGADDSTAISPDTTIQGGTGSLTITVPGCVYIGSPQPSPDQPMSPAQGATPTGAILPYAGEMSPEGYLLCNGAAINRTTYATLFGVIGETYGVGNGNTTFNLPDLRGRFPLGLDNMGGTSADRVTAAEADSLNGGGGAETHTLTIDEMPAHRHHLLTGRKNSAGTTPDEQIVYAAGKGRTMRDLGNSFDSHHPYGRYVPALDGVGGSNSAADMPAIENTGGSGAHNNMPPYLSLNYIIKT